MKSIIIGASDLANQLYFHIKKCNMANVVAFAANKSYIQNDVFSGLPLVEIETLQQYYPPNEHNIYLAIGYTQMNRARQKIYEILKSKGYEFPNFILPTAITNCESIGEANIVLDNTVIDCFAGIGDGNIFAANSLIAHNSTVGNFNFFAVRSCVCGHVQIENNCFLGANCTIKNGVHIKDKTLIGAGAYLAKNSEVGQVIVPAKSLILDDSSLDMKL